MRTARVLGLAALAGGQTRTIEIERLPLAAFDVAGDIFVRCENGSHDLAIRTDSVFTDDSVDCARHAGGFAIRTGQATASPGEMPLGTGADRVEDTDIQNDVE